jgi:aspartate kinase
LSEIEKKFSIGALVIDKDVTRVSVVGAGLSADSAAIARLVSVLESNEISPRLLSFTGLRITCLVPTNCAKRAVESLHAEFKLAKTHKRQLVLTA